jgi:hypothetical protein
VTKKFPAPHRRWKRPEKLVLRPRLTALARNECVVISGASAAWEMICLYILT